MVGPGDELPDDGSPHNINAGLPAQSYDITEKATPTVVEDRTIIQTDVYHGASRGYPMLSKTSGYDLYEAYAHPVNERPKCIIETEDSLMQTRGRPIQYGLRMPGAKYVMVVEVDQFRYLEYETDGYLTLHELQKFLGATLTDIIATGSFSGAGTFDHTQYPGDLTHFGQPQLCEPDTNWSTSASIHGWDGADLSADGILSINYSMTSAIGSVNETSVLGASGGEFGIARTVGPVLCAETGSAFNRYKTISMAIAGHAYVCLRRDYYEAYPEEFPGGYGGCIYP